MLNTTDHLEKMFCKRFIIFNDCLYKTIDSKHLIPSLILTPKMLTEIFSETYSDKKSNRF